ncbi:MAG: aldo/keto reductase [Bacteriovoracaceae bacterium]
MNLTFKLANTVEINRMGFGGMQLTGTGVFGDATDRPNAIKLLQMAVENGVNFFDTADSYGPHTNETLFADALHPYKNIFIATKGGLVRPGPGQWVPNGKPEYLTQAIEASLKRLKVDCIDLWQLHRVDSKYSIEESLAPVAAAVKAGKIKYVGLSEVDVDQIERAQKVVPIVSVQNLFNLGNRRWENVVDYTNSKNIAFIPWYPLNSGPNAFSSVVGDIARIHQVSMAQIALAWLLRRSENILLIPGTKSIDHLLDNIKASQVQLSESEFQKLINF